MLDGIEYMRRDYLSDIVDSFIIGNTKYINILRLQGLTRSEINHCCLLTLGLNSKEAGSITQNRNTIITVVIFVQNLDCLQMKPI